MSPEPDWHRLIPSEPYRFHMGLSPGTAASFFASTLQHNAILKERVRWLHASPADYFQLLPEGYPLFEETIQLAHEWGLGLGSGAGSGVPADSEDHPQKRCLLLGQLWEPDFLMLKLGEDGTFRLVGGVVCFPSSWSLADKIGRAVSEIHGVVPQLNQELGRQIDSFMLRISPRSAWERANWGLSRGSDLNRHPKLDLPVLDENTPLEEVFVRVEKQIFFRMPQSLGLLFGIRLSHHRLIDLAMRPNVARGLQQALESMPERVMHYKGICQIRSRLLSFLAQSEKNLIKRL